MTSPSVPTIVFPDLESGDAELFVAERHHDGVEFNGIDLGGRRAHDRDLLECLLIAVGLHEATLTGSRFRDTRLERCEATSLRLNACEFRDVEVDGCRFGALEAFDGELLKVQFSQCRLGYVNLRGSALTDIEFVGCAIEDLDLGSAQVERLTFTDCTIGHLLLSDAELSNVDLRGASLSEITAPERLRGATVSEGQLAALAPLLATHLGIEVAELAD